MNVKLSNWLSSAILAALLVSTPSYGQSDRSFATPEDAVKALIEALENGDHDALLALLGPDNEGILDSGDAVADRAEQANFLTMYRTRHVLEADSDTQRTLVIGDKNWPFAVPIVEQDGAWQLDGDAGAEEIIYRRIGTNELGAIAVCRGLVEAQHDYAAEGRDGDPAGIYAFKLISDEGLHNGLYWPAQEGETQSPLGPLIAAAAAEGYSHAEERQPYHGYYYRMLYEQSDSADGGARDYFQDGVLTQGFALIAWPAQYGIGGVMTFIVNQDGVVYQQDLGDDTATVADGISSFDPGAWVMVPEKTLAQKE